MNAAEGEWAVVTGAAGGLGACFASKLAERGFSLLLVDRREKQLQEICAAITTRHGVAAEPCAMNLCQQDVVEALARRLSQLPHLALLVNNAGFGTTDYFVEIEMNQHVDMVRLHVLTPMMLTRAVLPGMIERDRGAIINVSSLAAWSYSAGNVQYAATKTYLAVLSESLQEELYGTNVRVQALCPGFVRTEFHDAEGMKDFDFRRVPRRMWMSADDVVNCSLRKLSGRRVIVFPGMRYRLLGRLMQMPLFQPFVRRMAGRRRAARRRRNQGRSNLDPPAPRAAEEPAQSTAGS
jgi:short-subunit dehydrogenase